MSTDKSNISTVITTHYRGLKIEKTSLNRLVETICRRFRLKGAKVNITIVGDSGIREINRKFLKHNYNTDVISFDLSDENDKTPHFEIVVNGQMAKRKAKSYGHSARAEAALYIAHGLLHNLGFDDEDETDAERMHRTEDKILHQLGYGVIYHKGNK